MKLSALNYILILVFFLYTSSFAQIFNPLQQTSYGSAEEGTLSGQSAFYLKNSVYDAIKRKDWEEGLQKIIEYINATRNSSAEPDVNRADYYLTASMLCWNTDRLSQAEDMLTKSINYMKSGKNLGNGCEERAKIFLAKMRSRELPETFTYIDICMNIGIHEYIMEFPRAQFNNSIRATIARYDTMIKRLDGEIQNIETQRRHNAWRAKAYASQEYQKQTHKVFNPNNPPSLYSPEREYWDAAKRIYKIFEDK